MLTAADVARLLMERVNENNAYVLYSETDEDGVPALYVIVASIVPDVKSTRKISVDDLENLSDILAEMSLEVGDFVESIPQELKNGGIDEQKA